MAVKRFPTPVHLEPLDVSLVERLEWGGYVRVRVRKDGYEIMVELREDVVALSVDHVYALQSDQNGFQVTIFLANQLQEIWMWSDDGELRGVMQQPVGAAAADDSEAEDDDYTIVDLDDGDAELINSQRLFAATFGAGRVEVGEG